MSDSVPVTMPLAKPAAKASAVERETDRLIEWFRLRARTNAGLIAPFTNSDAIAELRSGTLKNEARAHGNIQSRVDFACYRCSLPPLGLAADSSFRNAWQQEERPWAFPKDQMQAAAQTRSWEDADFQRVLAAVRSLPLTAADAWSSEMALPGEPVRAWAESFRGVTARPRAPSAVAAPTKIDWTRDELILALAQYLKHEGRDLGDRHPEIVELSEFLNQLGAVLGVRGGAKFRNPNGVAMKLMNFRRHDPHFKNAGKAGLKSGNKLEQPVWHEFAGNPQRLAQVVASIRATVGAYRGRSELAGEDELEITEAPEGKVLTRLHRFRERSGKLVQQAKANALKRWGRLSCAGCTFDFGGAYGPESAHIIDCHHTKPVSTLATDGGKTHISDLVLLCANCHRVVHSRRPWLSIPELKTRIATARSPDSAS